MLPIRCFTCNYIISKCCISDDIVSFGFKYAFEKYKLKYCCRNILMTHVDLNEVICRSSEEQMNPRTTCN